MLNKEIQKAIDEFNDSPIAKFYEEKGESRASYIAEMKIRANTPYYKQRSRAGGLKNLESGHLKKLNEEILTSEKRSKNSKKEISPIKLKEGLLNNETFTELANELNVSVQTLSKRLKENDLYETPQTIYKVCPHCNIESDLPNYKAHHDDNCKLKHFTKKMILEAHKLFSKMEDVIKYLDITLKDYERLLKKFKIKKQKFSNQEKGYAGAEKTKVKIKVWEFDSTKPDGKGKVLGIYDSQTDAAPKLGVSRMTVLDAIRKRYKKNPKFVIEKVKL
jgi:transcriptional regulator with XRE-family HTH domain